MFHNCYIVHISVHLITDRSMEVLRVCFTIVILSIFLSVLSLTVPGGLRFCFTIVIFSIFLSVLSLTVPWRFFGFVSQLLYCPYFCLSYHCPFHRGSSVLFHNCYIVHISVYLITDHSMEVLRFYFTIVILSIFLSVLSLTVPWRFFGFVPQLLYCPYFCPSYHSLTVPWRFFGFVPQLLYCPYFCLSYHWPVHGGSSVLFHNCYIVHISVYLITDGSMAALRFCFIMVIVHISVYLITDSSMAILRFSFTIVILSIFLSILSLTVPWRFFGFVSQLLYCPYFCLSYH